MGPQKERASLDGKKAERRPAAKQQLFLLKRKTDFPLVLEEGGDCFDEELNQQYRRKTDAERCEKLSDEKLIKVVLSQNRDVYEILFRRYQRKLFSYIYHFVSNRDEAEDILQSVFIKTFKSIDHFDTDKKFSSWIYRIAHNEAINHLKRRNKKHFVSWEDIVSTKDKLETKSSEEGPDEIWVHKEISKEVHEAIDKLPQKYRQILELRYFADYSYGAIGKILDKPVNTVGTLINRAKGKLQEIIKEQEDK